MIKKLLKSRNESGKYKPGQVLTKTKDQLRVLAFGDNHDKTAELLTKSGCKLNFFSGDELCIKAEGGPTCLTRPILRI